MTNNDKHKSPMKNRRIYYSSLIVICIFIVYLGIKSYAEKTVQRNLEKEIKKINQFADIQYDDLNVDILHQRIRLTDVVIIPRFWKEEIRIDESVFYGFENEDGIPSNIHFNLEGIHLNLTHPKDVVKTYIDSLGLQNAKADLECELSYDKKNRVLNVKQIKLGAGGIGKAEMSLRLKNIDSDAISALPQNIILLLITLSGISIESAEIKYQDETLMDKVMTVAARQKSQKVDDYYQSLVRLLEQESKNENNPEVKEAIKGIQNFFKKKDKISIKLVPDRPVSFGKLYWIREPKHLIDLLGIKIAA